MSNLPDKSNLKTVRELLLRHQAEIAAALPRHMTPERMIRVALSAVSSNYQLLQADPFTCAGAIVQASILGLEPCSVLGEAYLVPFRNKRRNGVIECQLIPGYLGLVKLARQSGEVSFVDAVAVHENDHFEFTKGTQPTITHYWNPREERGSIIGYYAAYTLINGAANFEYMSVKEIEEHRDRYSKNARDKDGNLTGPWKESPEWMFKKTPLRKLCKLMPKSVNLARAVALDERSEAGIVQVFPDAPLELQSPEALAELEPGPEEPKRKEPEK